MKDKVLPWTGKINCTKVSGLFSELREPTSISGGHKLDLSYKFLKFPWISESFHFSWSNSKNMILILRRNNTIQLYGKFTTFCVPVQASLVLLDDAMFSYSWVGLCCSTSSSSVLSARWFSADSQLSLLKCVR